MFHGPAVKKHILYVPKNGEGATPLDFTYYNAVHTVENALAKVKDDKGLKRVARFLREGHAVTVAARVSPSRTPSPGARYQSGAGRGHDIGRGD